MRVQGYIYDALSLILIFGSLFFFYQSTQFLLVKDYVSSGLTIFIGFLIIRIGVELGKLALLSRRLERDQEHKK